MNDAAANIVGDAAQGRVERGRVETGRVENWQDISSLL
jgi:hypothetical protein